MSGFGISVVGDLLWMLKLWTHLATQCEQHSEGNPNDWFIGVVFCGVSGKPWVDVGNLNSLPCRLAFS